MAQAEHGEQPEALPAVESSLWVFHVKRAHVWSGVGARLYRDAMVPSGLTPGQLVP